MTDATNPTAVSPAGRSERIALVVLDLMAIAVTVVGCLLVRSGLRANDPLSLDRLAEVTRATITIYLVSVPLMLALCGRYSRRPDSLGVRRTATGVLLSAAAISVWSVYGDQTWWLFMPVFGSVALIASLTATGRLLGLFARRRG